MGDRIGDPRALPQPHEPGTANRADDVDDEQPRRDRGRGASRGDRRDTQRRG